MRSTFEAVQADCVAQTTVATPCGPMLLAATDRGLAGAWFAGQRHHPGVLPAPDLPEHPVLQQAAGELASYFAGGTATRFKVPLDLFGTPFQRRVWQALRAIAPGDTTSYGALARVLGAAQAVRAVGGAIGRNPVSVIVPCHRVVGSAGALTGYAGGIDRKQALLDLERALRAVDSTIPVLTDADSEAPAQQPLLIE